MGENNVGKQNVFSVQNSAYVLPPRRVHTGRDILSLDEPHNALMALAEPTTSPRLFPHQSRSHVGGSPSALVSPTLLLKWT